MKKSRGSTGGKQNPPAPKLVPNAPSNAGQILTPFVGRVSFGKGK